MRPGLAIFVALCGIGTGCQKPGPEPRNDWPDNPEQWVQGAGPLPAELVQQPVPQDADAMRRLRAARLAWWRASTAEAYPKVGRRDPKWDAAAVDALEKVAAAKANSDRDRAAAEAAADALDRAAELGCADPCVRYWRAQYQRGTAEDGGPTSKDLRREFLEAAGGLRDSAYPAVRRAHAAHNYAFRDRQPPQTADQVEAMLAEDDFRLARKLFGEALTDDPAHTADDYAGCMKLTIDFCSQAPDGAARVYDAFRDAVPDGQRFDALRHRLAGDYHVHVGWKARGNGWAANVPEENMQTFLAELGAAQAAYETAWDRDPTQTAAAVGMMCTLGPVADLDGLEVWFQRAMTADGDCADACRIKGTFLNLKWGGHPEAMRQFAARLVDTGNWDAGLPFIGLEVLLDVTPLGMTSHKVLGPDWPLAKRVYDDFLAAHPESRWGWTAYADFAYHNDQFETAVRAFEHVKDRPSPRAVRSVKNFEWDMGMARRRLSLQKR